MTDQLPEPFIELGQTGLMIPHLGIGTWQWGDTHLWGFGRNYSKDDVKEAFSTSLSAGITFFDTAESYGGGKSERLLGSFITEMKQPAIVATKFLPYPWRIWKKALSNTLLRSLKRLNIPKVDLYQIHCPLPPMPVEYWAKALAEAVKEGLARTVGVSNYSTDQMRRTYDVLAKEGIPLASNQVEYSLLDRTPEKKGLLAACKELRVTLIAYSPIAKGALSGKYSPENPMPGIRGQLYNRERLARIQPLSRTMWEIGQMHGSKTLVQVALNWCICKGAVPIPGVKNARQAEENAGALGWRLTEDEVIRLDAACDKLNEKRS